MVTAKQGKISFEFPLKVEDYVNGSVRAVGEYKFETGLQQTPGFVFRDRKRYFRIGIVNVRIITIKLWCMHYTTYLIFCPVSMCSFPHGQ